MNSVPGRNLTEPEWLSARIAEMGCSWGTTEPRVSGTLWWCMVASALVEQLARAYATGSAAPEPALDRLDCEVRPDGGIERVHILPATDIEAIAEPPAEDVEGRGVDATALPPESETGTLPGRDADVREVSDLRPACTSADADRPRVRVPHGSQAVGPRRATDAAALSRAAATTLRETLAAVIGPVAAVSGAGVPSLWAIAADAIGNRALDAGNPDAGARLATEVGGKLPVPRFVEIGGRSFVRRISCCLVFEVPGCEMCTSCPKRPAAERTALLTELAAESR
ncbi:(2Fe-2S)-binding protein [Nocardia sp. CA-119907]|uniref:(2Fe-2S)-binding protein n=1 Tax=Nocardia sp. CA-119907 TaxID=3239973 RepID=UPI003D966A4E